MEMIYKFLKRSVLLHLTLTLLDSIVLSHKMLLCDHSNESYWAVLSCSTVCYAVCLCHPMSPFVPLCPLCPLVSPCIPCVPLCPPVSPCVPCVPLCPCVPCGPLCPLCPLCSPVSPCGQCFWCAQKVINSKRFLRKIVSGISLCHILFLTDLNGEF